MLFIPNSYLWFSQSSFHSDLLRAELVESLVVIVVPSGKRLVVEARWCFLNARTFYVSNFRQQYLFVFSFWLKITYFIFTKFEGCSQQGTHALCISPALQLECSWVPRKTKLIDLSSKLEGRFLHNDYVSPDVRSRYSLFVKFYMTSRSLMHWPAMGYTTAYYSQLTTVPADIELTSSQDHSAQQCERIFQEIYKGLER